MPAKWMPRPCTSSLSLVQPVIERDEDQGKVFHVKKELCILESKQDKDNGWKKLTTLKERPLNDIGESSQGQRPKRVQEPSQDLSALFLGIVSMPPSPHSHRSSFPPQFPHASVSFLLPISPFPHLTSLSSSHSTEVK